MPSSPLVSVVMAVLNGERYIKDALDSIARQSFRDIEFIVINDGSTDSTAQILKRHAQLDARLLVVDQEHRGLIAALNSGCQLARGQYIARLDADDISVPDRLGKQLDFLARHPAVAVLGGAFRLIDPQGRALGDWRCPLADQQIRERLRRGNCMRHSAIMMRKRAFDATGGYRGCFLHAEDYDLWLRMAERCELANLPDVLVQCRLHAHQISATNVTQQALSSLAAQAAARIRKDTGREPPLPAGAVDAESLLHLGVSRDRMAQELARRHLHWARHMAQIGECGLADGLLRAGLELARLVGRSDRTCGARADHTPRQGACPGPVRTFGSLAQVAARSPALAVCFIRSAWVVGTCGLRARRCGR
jgi:hypothetical protein